MISIESILAPVLVLGFLIFFHELGHFLVAKWCGVGVLRFSVGFGPAIYKKRYKETVYQLSIIPLGGYVRMAGDMPDMITGAQETDEAVRGEAKESQVEEEVEAMPPEVRRVVEDRSYWFLEKNLWQRSAIVFAGPLFNFILAALLVFISVFTYGEETIASNAKIGSVVKVSPAGEAGILPGDVILAMGDRDISSWEELAEGIRKGDGEPTRLLIERADETLALTVTPERKEIIDPELGKTSIFLIGIGPAFERQSVGFFRSMEVGVKWTSMATQRICIDLYGLLTGRISTNELAGPLFILGEAGRRAERGLESVLSFMAILSVSLAVLNLLPIPILDGGHLVFFLLEGLFGPMSIRKKEIAQQVGFVMLLSLMVLALHNDIFIDRSAMHQQVVEPSTLDEAIDTTPSAED